MPRPKPQNPTKGSPWRGRSPSGTPELGSETKNSPTVVRQVSQILPAGGRILEVAPGPGYLAIELAKIGKYQIAGIDVSKSFVEIAQGKAKQAGVAIDFRHGKASNMPFDNGSFDLIVCRAAFKNFTEPIQALDEMHRVLKHGDKALIIDLRRDASREDIKTLIKSLELSWISTFITKWTFKLFLLKNAYTN